MLRIDQPLCFGASLGVSLCNRELRAGGFIVSLEDTQGALFDYFTHKVSARAMQWVVMHINLTGRVRLQVPGYATEHQAGTLFLGAGISSVFLRAVPGEARHRILTLALPRPDQVMAVTHHVAAASRQVVAQARHLSGLLDTGASNHTVCRAVRQLISALHASGIDAFPIDEVETRLSSITTADDQVLASAFEAVMSRPDLHPALSDVAARIGLGERQTNRKLRSLLARYYATHAAWSDYTAGYRLSAAVVLASCPAATPERIARLSGFRHPSSLCHAFAAAGFRSPAALGRAMRAGDGVRGIAAW